MCIHMSDTLPMAYGLVWHFPSPSEADLCAIEPCGTFSHMGLRWAWFFVLLINAKSIHTMYAKVYEFQEHQNAKDLRR